MAISYVADAEWSEASSDTGYTLQKPAGVASGDFLIAVLGIDLLSGGSSDTSVNAPSGWTLVGSVHSPPNHQMAVLKRTAGSSEPGSWNGTLGSSRGPKASIVVAYRGATGIATSGGSPIEDFNTTGTATSLGTGTVNNPVNTNWRIVLGSYSSASVSYTLSSTESTKREGVSNTNVECAAWDSNGTIGTGNTSRSISRGQIWESAAVYIAILDATDGTAVSGTLSATMPLPTMTAQANPSYTGTMAAAIPTLPTVTMEGIATPPEGPLTVLVLPVVDVTAATAASGTMTIDAGPIVDIKTETRFFGIRVVTPEAEDRTIRPRLGAVD